MAFKDWLEEARGLLTPVAKTYLRDTLKLDKDDNPIPPSEPSHIILDLITATGQYSSSCSASIADSVVLQAGVWSKNGAAACYDLAEEARTALEGSRYRLTGVASQRDGHWRGCIMTIEKVH